MNLNELHDKVIAMARKHPPGEHVPYAFEKRVMSHIAAFKPMSAWALWGGPLWRAAISCVAITVVCGIWSFNATRHADSQESFSQAFEAAVFAPPSQHVEDAW